MDCERRNSYDHSRNIRDLTPVDINHIIADASKRCYTEIAEEFDIPVNTVKKVIRQHNHAILKRYK